MSYPFQRLTTEKLRNYFKNLAETNCEIPETNPTRQKQSGKKNRNKLVLSDRVLKAWIHQQIDS